VFRLLGGLDDRGLVEVALVVYVKLAKGILKTKDLPLRKLGVFPVRNVILAIVEADGYRAKVGRGGTYFCSLITFIVADVGE
jgi:hypothetical protein